jgi:hypothetical protein
LPAIPAYIVKAHEIAVRLAKTPGIKVSPNPPHTNEFSVFLSGNPNRIANACTDLIRETRIWIKCLVN